LENAGIAPETGEWEIGVPSRLWRAATSCCELEVEGMFERFKDPAGPDDSGAGSADRGVPTGVEGYASAEEEEPGCSVPDGIFDAFF